MRYCQVKRDVIKIFQTYFTDAYFPLPLPPSSLPRRDYQSLRLVILRFALSFRDVEEMMASRGVCLSYERVREWCLKFAQTYANGLRHKSPRPGDQWHLDEVFLKINGRLHYLWRAVDQDGDVLDVLVQSRRDKKAVKKFFRKLLTGLRYVPRVIITDKLRSYSSAKAEVMPSVEHLRSVFSRPSESLRHTSKFGRHLYRASGYRAVMKARFAVWEEAICVEAIVN